MLVRFLSNNVEHHCNNEVGRALIAEGRAVEVKKPAPPPPEPVWTVCLDPSGYVAIKLELGKLGPSPENPQGTSPKSVQWYQGDPKTIHNRKYADGTPYSSAFGRPVPKEVVDEYRRARRDPEVCRPVDTVTDDTNRDMAALLKSLGGAIPTREGPKVPVQFSEREALADLAKGIAPFFVKKDPAKQKPKTPGAAFNTPDGVVWVGSDPA